MAVYTQCPECLAIYKIAASTAVEARGRVRCGSCAAEFDALATLADELPPEPVHTLPRHEYTGEPPLLAVPSLRPQSTSQSDFFEDPAAAFAAARSAPRPATRADSTMRATRERASEKLQPKITGKAGERPSFAKAHARRSARAGSLGWTLGAVALALALVAQFAWAYRAPLLANRDVQRVVERVCATLECAVPAAIDASRIVVLSRDVRPHPTVANALVISATIQNTAPFAQPFPTVEITLADPNDQRIAMRRFVSGEYVSDTAALARGLAAGATASLTLEVEDPGKNAVAFEFKFL